MINQRICRRLSANAPIAAASAKQTILILIQSVMRSVVNASTIIEPCVDHGTKVKDTLILDRLKLDAKMKRNNGSKR